MPRKKAPPKETRAVGRPTVMTEDVIAKLEMAFAIGATDAEACAFAEISADALYDYQKDHPEFAERKEQLKQRPILKARATVDRFLDLDRELAFKFLQAKRKEEFSTRSEVTGKDGQPIELGIVGIVREALEHKKQVIDAPQEANETTT